MSYTKTQLTAMDIAADKAKLRSVFAEARSLAAMIRHNAETLSSGTCGTEVVPEQLVARNTGNAAEMRVIESTLGGMIGAFL